MQDPATLEKLVVLKCSDNETRFPIEVLNQWDITHLEIIGGQFTYFPEDISILKYLKSFSLISTQVQVLPKELFELPMLDCLNLKNNKISALPELKHFSTIRHLNLGRNHLSSSSLKNFFIKIPYLNSLDLGHNKLRSIPESLKYLKDLRRLNLEGNKITDFPEELKELKELTHLSLINNPFTSEEKVRIQKEFKLEV